MPKVPLGPVLRRYFCEYLVSQRDLSPQTIGSYRDTFRLLLAFLERRYRIKPDVVCVDDLDAPRVLTFLDDLERRRGNTARTRNARRAAIRSFLRYAAAANPLLLPVAQRVLAIPAKRFERASVGYLTREQIQAIIDSPDTATFSGQRDRILLMLLYNTGARVSELAGLQIQDVSLESRMSVHIHGKGRKNRSVPLWRQTVKLLRAWLRQLNGTPDSPLLPNARGNPMTRSGIAQRLQVAVKRAAADTSVAAVDANLASPDSAHDRHAPASVGRGPIGDRHVAWPRNDPDDPSIPGCRPGIQETSPRVSGATPRAQVAPIPRRRHRAVPEGPVIMRTARPREPP